eukprot:GHVU01147155.1.p2 GENE.GHVU01147155.1~~GHVU01147155.1.p2  ORF type:complete len:128 (+),score=21.15 GHVU01147155.1:186-569(+)
MLILRSGILNIGVDICKNEREERGKMLIASCPPRPPCSMRTHNMPSVVCGPATPQGGARRWNSCRGMVPREGTVRGENKKHGEANGEEECEEKREEEEEEEETSQCFPEALDVQPQRWIRVRRSSES